jgi:hypothetical protein
VVDRANGASKQMSQAPHSRVKRATCARWAAAALLVATSWFSPAAARAQILGEPVHLSYAAPLGCPTEAEFHALVAARTTHLLRPGATGAARSFTITIDAAPGRARGALVIREASGREATREVPGEDCREVAEALALITAVAIDADARDPAAASPPVPLTPPSAPAIARSEPPRPAFTAPTPGFSQPRRAAAPYWRLSVGTHLVVTGAVAPDPLFGLQLLADVTLFSDWALAPTFRLSFVRGRSALASTDDGYARFTWLAGRLEVCPSTWPRSAASPRAAGPVRVGISPCALLDLGALTGEGSNTLDAADETRPWVAPGLLGRLQLDLFRALLLEVEAGVTFPLLKYRYYFSPTTTVFTVPTAALFGGLGVGARFP